VDGSGTRSIKRLVLAIFLTRSAPAWHYVWQLLGTQSNDIDIALTNIMGVTFAEHFVAFAKDKGIKTGKVAKIETNPDQSKHLETARFSLFGLDLDLVNLRSEKYTEESRIPTEVVSTQQGCGKLTFWLVPDLRYPFARCIAKGHHN
jgi:hypothetical protein